MNSITQPVLIVPDWQVPTSVVAFSSTRRGGVSRSPFGGLNLATHVGDDPQLVIQNRDILTRALNEDVHLQWLNQVHGTGVVEAHRNQNIPEADAAFTSNPKLACCIATADCLPVLLTSISGDIVAAIHAGWRGLAAGILEVTVSKFSCPQDEIVAWLGPAIGPCHFEVGLDVRDTFLQSATAQSETAVNNCFQRSKISGKFFADLYALARIALNQLGVTRISGGGYCTHCQADDFYSFRRQGETGRMVSLIYLRS